MEASDLVVVTSADSDKDAMELQCNRCNEVVCDIEPGAQTVQTLVESGGAHVCSDHIEVVVYRDPDGDTDVAVFRGGIEVQDAAVTVVDPGTGWTEADWNAQRWETGVRSSPEVDTALSDAFDRGAATEFVGGGK